MTQPNYNKLVLALFSKFHDVLSFQCLGINMADDNIYTQRLKNASLLEMSDSAGRMLTFLSIDM